MKKLRGLTDSLRKEGEDQSTSQQDQLTTLFIKQIQQFKFCTLDGVETKLYLDLKARYKEKNAILVFQLNWLKLQNNAEKCPFV